jgi:hypothetical protein
MTSVFENFADTFNVSPTCYRGYIIQGIVIRFWGRKIGSVGREQAWKSWMIRAVRTIRTVFSSGLFDGHKAIARAAYIVHSVLKKGVVGRLDDRALWTIRTMN